MPKAEYEIGGRSFWVEKRRKQWVGWFSDDPDRQFSGPLKKAVLAQVDYEPAGTGIRISTGVDDSTGSLQVSIGPVSTVAGRTMLDAYRDLRRRLSEGRFPRFDPASDVPLSKFIILARDGCRCFYCEAVPDRDGDLQIDHVVPVVDGGQSVAGNLVTSCGACNLRKHATRSERELEIIREIQSRNALHGIADGRRVDVPLRPE